ncbi:hypothetical protein BH18ACT3_BH18ACT3_28700 [soil metagenome]
MLNACLHNPVMLAREVVTLVQLSGGRMELGLGAGHTPGEFAACGVPMEPAREREARLAEFVEIMRALLDGRTVEHHSDRYDLHGAATASPAAQERLPILVGGSGERLLTHAGSHADIIGFTGLGRRLADGHHHAVRFGTDVLDGETAFVRAGRRSDGIETELNVLVQVVDVTDDRVRAAARLGSRRGGADAQRRHADSVPGTRHRRRDRRSAGCRSCALGYHLLRGQVCRALRTGHRPPPLVLTPQRVGVTLRQMNEAKELAAAFVEQLDRRDWDAWTALLATDVVYEIPQTHERIRGRERYLQFNQEYPGDWHLETQVVVGDDHDAAVLFRWTVGDDEPALAIAFFEASDGRIVKVTDFWPEPYDPPPGREHLVERW